jgi:hypothetical protein
MPFQKRREPDQRDARAGWPVEKLELKNSRQNKEPPLRELPQQPVGRKAMLNKLNEKA